MQIYELLLCNQGYSRTEFDNHWKNFRFLKQLLENKLAGPRRQLRRMVLDRAVLQHKRRLSEASSSTVTATHRDILQALLALATSHYSEVSPLMVRREAETHACWVCRRCAPRRRDR